MNAIANAPANLSKQRICQALGQPRHRCYPDRRRRAKVSAKASPRRLPTCQHRTQQLFPAFIYNIRAERVDYR